MIIRDGLVDSDPTHIELIELQSEAIRERELVLDVRDAAEKLFEQYDSSAIEELPENEGKHHKVRELRLPDHVSDFECISIEEYSDRSLHVFVGFESDDYIDEKGNAKTGRMISSATISGENKLISANISVVGEYGGTTREIKFNARRDNPAPYLEHVLEVLEAEAIAYDTSISIGVRLEEEYSSRLDVNLGIILPEIALDTF